MAQAKKCDRCGKFYETNHATEYDPGTRIVSGVAFTNPYNSFIWCPKDLCDDCIAKFKRFMAGCELKEE